MTTLRVATYNIYVGADVTLVFGAQDPAHLLAQSRLVHRQLQATDFPARARALARLLANERIDVIGLQEVAKWCAQSRARRPAEPVTWCDFLGELLGALEEAGAAYDAHAASPNFSGAAPISPDESMSVLGSNVILVARRSGVEVTGTRTGTFRSSLEIPTTMDELVLNLPRSWGWIDAEVDGSAFRLVNTHTEAHDPATRDSQRDELLSEIGQSGAPVVVVGDFNATPDTVGMPSPYVDAWVAAGGDPRGGHTCGQAADLTNAHSALDERIDYIWVRGGRVDGCEVIGNREADRTEAANLWPSDHGGVVATWTF